MTGLVFVLSCQFFKNLAKLNVARPKLSQKWFSCLDIYFVWFRLVLWALRKWNLTGSLSYFGLLTGIIEPSVVLNYVWPHIRQLFERVTVLSG